MTEDHGEGAIAVAIAFVVVSTGLVVGVAIAALAALGVPAL